MVTRFFSRILMRLILAGTFCLLSVPCVAQDAVKIGMNYPKTGPYSVQGLDQWRAAEIALEEINSKGGILGKKIEIAWLDSKSEVELSVSNVTRLIEKESVKMIFGGVSSGVAVAVSKVCQDKGVIFMATITASNATTGEKGHRHTFRVCYNAWMGAKAMGYYLKKNFGGKKYFYIVSDYTWGWSSEASIRKFTGTEDTSVHKRMLTPLGAESAVFKKAVSLARVIKPDVLVLALFGKDMSTAIRHATLTGLKKNSQIVVPILELGLAEGAGPKVMEGVIGTADWNWQVPYKYNYERGKLFVEKFAAKYNRYPCWGAVTSYTNLIEYKNAAERTGTFDSPAVVRALEGHKFTLLKDEQSWRDFDHQCVQSVYIVKCKPRAEVLRDKFKLDYFHILNRFPGEEMVQSRTEWNRRREAAGLPARLEKFMGE
ncbi:substrate-binding protein [Desulfobacterales bacterium HSG2]|nr:substrate-binding protein [Desulfobacterales bacterium HSG2]